MEHVDIHQAQAHLSRLLERAHTGEVIVITKRGKPYARLAPLEPRRPGLLEGEVGGAFFEPLPDEDLQGWE